MSRIPSGNHPAGQPANGPVSGPVEPGSPIPTPIAIVPFASTVGALPPHDAPPPLPTTSTTTTTTTTTASRAGRRLERAMSQHRVAPRLDRSADTPDTAGRRPTPSPMGRSAPLPTVSQGEGEGEPTGERMPDQPSFVVRKVTLLQSGRQQSAPRLGRKLSEHRLPRTMTRSGEAPRPTAPELRPSSPMGNSAPAELAPNNESDLKKKWISDIKEVKQSDWCKAALKMIGKDATMPKSGSPEDCPSHAGGPETRFDRRRGICTLSL